jgi:hypothetical protein
MDQNGDVIISNNNSKIIINVNTKEEDDLYLSSDSEDDDNISVISFSSYNSIKSGYEFYYLSDKDHATPEKKEECLLHSDLSFDVSVSSLSDSCSYGSECDLDDNISIKSNRSGREYMYDN